MNDQIKRDVSVVLVSEYQLLCSFFNMRSSGAGFSRDERLAEGKLLWCKFALVRASAPADLYSEVAKMVEMFAACEVWYVCVLKLKCAFCIFYKNTAIWAFRHVTHSFPRCLPPSLTFSPFEGALEGTHRHFFEQSQFVCLRGAESGFGPRHRTNIPTFSTVKISEDPKDLKNHHSFWAQNFKHSATTPVWCWTIRWDTGFDVSSLIK